VSDENPRRSGPDLDDPSDELSTGSLARRASRGLSWSLLGTLVLKLGSFVMALVVARLVVPADYGAYAIALAATHFVMHVNDVGLIAATVQWRGKLEEMSATASTMALAFSGILYGIFWFVAEPFARLAGAPEAAGVVRVLTLTILIDGVTAVRAGALMRRFEQDKITKANAAGFLITATLTIGLAAWGAGAYSFAYGQVAGGVITGLLIMIWAKVPLRYGLDKVVARRLLVFGIPLAASLGVEAIVMNADYVIVGNVLGATALGYYLLAFNISSWVPGVIGTAVRYVSVAGFARLSEKESTVLSAGVERTVPLLVTGLLPIAVLMGTLADPLVLVLFGPAWQPAATVLQLLMILTVVRMLTAFGFDILAGAGATKSALWVNVGWSVALIPALWIGTHRGGIHGAALAHALVALVVALPLTAFALHRVGVRLVPVGRALVRPLLGGAAMFLVCLVVLEIPASPVVQLLAGGLFGTAVFVATGVSRADRRQVMATVQRVRKRRTALPT
jgi:O-antigen/teichoic acid export membrane protein